jgi:hypothetical protein
MSTYTVETIVRGYHVYREVWKFRLASRWWQRARSSSFHFFVGGSNTGRWHNGRQTTFRLW